MGKTDTPPPSYRDTNNLNLRTGLDDLLSSLVGVLLEVLVEQSAELLDLALEVCGTRPALGRVKQLIGDVGASLGHREVEGVVDLVLDVCELAAVDGVENGTSVLERATLAAGGGAGSDPTGVEEPCVGLVLLDLLGQHLCVAHGVEGKEGLSEARGEGGLGLGDTVFGAGHLGGVTGDEVEHGLLGVELGDWWENTTSITGEEDDVSGVAGGDARNLGILNVLNGVSATSVLGEGRVVVVDLTGLGVEDDVLKNGTEADGTVNIGLLLGGETNALGVATTLNVEDTLVGPAVLVVTDKGTLGVGGESGLASTGETEEDGDITALALVCGGVESKDVVLDGHLVEENSEDLIIDQISMTQCHHCVLDTNSFFHFSSVFGTKDNHLLLGEVEGDGGCGGHTSGESVGGESTGIVDGVVGVESLKLFS